MMVFEQVPQRIERSPVSAKDLNVRMKRARRADVALSADLLFRFYLVVGFTVCVRRISTS